MSEKIRQTELQEKSQELLSGTLKHVRVAALAALLVPLGTVVMTPISADAQTTSHPPVSLPEPATAALLTAGLAALAVAKRRDKK